MTIQQEGDFIVACLDAEYSGFDEARHDRTQDALVAAVVDADKPKVILDLSKTNYFGSLFLELLFKIWHRVDRKGGTFALAGLQPYCRDVLRVTRLDTIWNIYPDVEAAKKAAV